MSRKGKREQEKPNGRTSTLMTYYSTYLAASKDIDYAGVHKGGLAQALRQGIQ
jgi:hypothetical protein